MKKRTLVEYAKKMFEINKTKGADGEDFSATLMIEEFKVSPTQARRILKELHEEEFLDKIKIVGKREPIYILNRHSENILKELEEEARKEPKKITKTIRYASKPNFDYYL